MDKKEMSELLRNYASHSPFKLFDSEGRVLFGLTDPSTPWWNAYLVFESYRHFFPVPCAADAHEVQVLFHNAVVSFRNHLGDIEAI